MFQLLFALCLIWGFNFVVMKTANEYFSPELFVTLRFILGASILFAYASIRKLNLPKREFWIWIAITGALQISIGAAIVQTCFKYLSAGLVSVLNYTMPLWVIILARIFLDEPLTKKKIIGIVTSILGVAILMNVDISGDIFGVFLAILGAIVWAAANVITKKKLAKCDPIALTTWQMIIGAILLAIYTFGFVENHVDWSFIGIACLAYNGIIASALAFFLWIYILEHMEAGKASISVLGVPVVGVIGGVLILGEPFTISMAIGMLMVFSGIVLVQHS